MARLEAVEKMLYYPTPLRVVDMVAKKINHHYNQNGRLLDPCAGEGSAAVRLGQHLRIKSYGVELDPSRAQAATNAGMNCLEGSLGHFQASFKSFSVLFLNPPYDRGAREEGHATRQEIQFLQDSLCYLCSGGVLVYIVPRNILSHPLLPKVLRYVGDVQVFEFPQPEVEDFDQVVLLGTKQGYTAQSHDFTVRPYDKVDKVSMYSNPDKLDLFEVRSSLNDDSTPMWERSNYAYGTLQWELLTGVSGIQTKPPLLSPRPGHQALLLAAGVLDDTPLGDVLMKGTSQKIGVEVKETTAPVEMPYGEKSQKTTTTVREKIVSRISTLDLKTGDYESWIVNDNQEKTGDFFKLHRDALNDAMQNLKPLFNGDLTPYASGFAKINAPGVLPGHIRAEILPAQRQTAAAICHNWQLGEKSTLLSGEIGVGKTTTATAALHLYGAKKFVVICPSHLTAKWQREVGLILGAKKCAVVAKRISDVDKFFADPDLRVLVISKEMAKLGSKWKSVFIKRMHIVEFRANSWERPTKRKHFRAHCPDCNAVVTDAEGSAIDPDELSKVRQKCRACGAALWTAVPLSEKGTARYPLASYIAKRYARRFSLVLDECHQFAKASTGQTQAVQDLVSSANKVLAMTGSLYGGRASSIFQLLYMLFASFRKLYAYDECSRFVAHHGLFETKVEVSETISAYGFKRGGQKRNSVREIPGMSPAMIPLLLPVTAFLKLRDLEIALPEYTEEVQVLPLERSVLHSVQSLQDEVKTVLRRHHELLGQYLMACLGYPDCPEQAEEIKTEDGQIIATAPAHESQLLAKDEATIQIALEEHRRGRKTLVYFAQTHRRDARSRVRSALVEAGLRVKVLDSNVAADKREEWLRKATVEGFDVLLTNGRLVETGLDLLFANTIIQYGIEYSIATLRQSVRRSWRLGQDKPVRVVFLGYAGTMQEQALNLIARKMRASELIEGDENGGLALHDEGGDNFFTELAQEVLSGKFAA